MFVVRDWIGEGKACEAWCTVEDKRGCVEEEEGRVGFSKLAYKFDGTREVGGFDMVEEEGEPKRRAGRMMGEEEGVGGDLTGELGRVGMVPGGS